MTDTEPSGRLPDIRAARDLFPATAGCAFFNTATVGLASRRLADSYRELIDEWVASASTTSAASKRRTRRGLRWRD
jgi:hypothetical protein